MINITSLYSKSMRLLTSIMFSGVPKLTRIATKFNWRKQYPHLFIVCLLKIDVTRVHHFV